MHEVVQCSQAESYELLKGVIDICNASESARNKDPEVRLRDALVLEKALEEDPTNSRYVYYLAVSYLAAEQYELALDSFKKRIAMKSTDVQETYMAIYSMGMVQEKINGLYLCFRKLLYRLPISS